MSIAELLPSIATLSHADKFRLAQIVLQQLAQEDGIMISSETTDIARLSESVLKNAWDNEEDAVYDEAKNDIFAQPANDFDPRRYFGIAHHTRQAVDDYLASAREGWN